MTKKSFLSFLFAGVSLMAMDAVFDFGKKDALKEWTVLDSARDKLAIEQGLAQAPAKALCFTTPKCVKKGGNYPFFEGRITQKDWSAYDRLVLDINSRSEADIILSGNVTDDKVPLEKGLYISEWIYAHSTKRIVLKLNRSKGLDYTAISRLNLYVEDPASDAVMSLFNIVLLKEGEALPPLSQAVVEAERLGVQDAIARLRSTLAPAVEAARKNWAGHPELLARLEQESAVASEAFDKSLGKIAALNDFDSLFKSRAELVILRGYLAHLQDVLAFQDKAVKAGCANDAMVATVVSSMVKVLPCHAAISLEPVGRASISLARNEWESFQVAVLPRKGALKNVKVSVEGLSDGKVAGPEAQVMVVGYLETKAIPPNKASHIGWWPDPLFPDMDACDVAGDVLQTFWVRLHAGKNQKAGRYSGKIRISADGVDALEYPLEVTVRNFTLKDCPMLPGAVAFFTPSGMFTPEEWSAKKFIYTDYLSSYLINMDNIYRRKEPDWELVKKLHKEGRLVSFNLGNVFNGGLSGTPEQLEQKIAETVERIRPAYDTAKKLGLLEYAFIYGFDECAQEQFDALERCSQALKKAFPEVLLMTTSYDHSFGADSIVKTMDAWTPLTPRYDLEKVAAARKAGRYVWWYICCGPGSPFANWFLEFDAIDMRSIMGPQSVKYRPDGFLYYSLAFWNQNRGITKRPFTDWNPVSWGAYHGDGSTFECDQDRNPLPSIRMENYRDGLEDYAYAVILEGRCRYLEAKQGRSKAEDEWLVKARKALKVPDSLVKKLDDFSHAPAKLLHWRRSMAAAIESAPIPDAEKTVDDAIRVNVRGVTFGASAK